MIRSFTKSERRGCAGRSSQWPRGAVRPIRLAPLRRHHQPIPTNACGTGWAGEAGNVRSGANLLHGACLPRLARSPTPGATKAGRSRPRLLSIPELPAVTSGGKGPCSRPADLDRLNPPKTCRVPSGIRLFRKPQSFLAPRGDISLPACIRARLTHRRRSLRCFRLAREGSTEWMTSSATTFGLLSHHRRAA